MGVSAGLQLSIPSRTYFYLGKRIYIPYVYVVYNTDNPSGSRSSRQIHISLHKVLVYSVGPWECGPGPVLRVGGECDRLEPIMYPMRFRALIRISISWDHSGNLFCNDGVASRAKLHNIRGGRFQSASFKKATEEIEDMFREQFEKEGKSLLPKEETKGVDSIAITPGTEFMHVLSEKLQSYIIQRMSENSAWGNIKVILSDDKVPGEGEHKIMSFIRAQRASPGYDPNTRHCVYGTDVDLIMLALATHEVHFSILREEPVRDDGVKRQVRQFLNVCVLREYLALDLEIPRSGKYEYDRERIIDDFIFICFFAGNDFLPRMHALRVQEGCIDLLMHVYKKEFHNFGGYLVDMQKVEDKTDGYINPEGVERFLLAVGPYEDKIFSKRSRMRERKSRRIRAEYKDTKDDEKSDQDDGRAKDILGAYAVVDYVDGVFRNTVELQMKVKDFICTQDDLFEDGLGIDEVRLRTYGWRERYYKENFSLETPEEIEATRENLVAEYGKGLCWVLLSYFSGVPSWSWFYPYYYGPLASDLRGLSQTKFEFDRDLPFKPFDQLMAVIPPSKAHLLPLPESYMDLLTDKNFKIIDYYPTEFERDPDGMRYSLQGIRPPLDEERLLKETRKLENELKGHEKIRNLETLDILFVRHSSEAGRQVVILCSGTRAASNQIEGAIMVESNIEGIKGTLHLMPGDFIEAADDNNKGEDSGNVICVFYETHQGLKHVPKLLQGVNIPPKMVKKEDIVENVLWHEHYGNSISRKSNTNRFQNQTWRKPDQKLEQQSPRNSSPALLISQGSHDGFSSDRGETSAAASCRSNSLDNFPVSGPVGELKPEQSLRPNYGTMCHHGGSEGVRKTDMNTRPMSNNRPPRLQADNNFWQSRSGVTYDANDDWRLNKLSTRALEEREDADKTYKS